MTAKETDQHNTNLAAEKTASQLKYMTYPTPEEPKTHGTLKIHEPDTPLRPTVSSTRSMTYNAAKTLANILTPSVRISPYHIKARGTS